MSGAVGVGSAVGGGGVALGRGAGVAAALTVGLGEGGIARGERGAAWGPAELGTPSGTAQETAVEQAASGADSRRRQRMQAHSDGLVEAPGLGGGSRRDGPGRLAVIRLVPGQRG